MSLRQSFPAPRLPDTHFFVTLSRGDNVRAFALRPVALYALAAIVPTLCLLYAAAAAWLFFRDDMLASLMNRQAQMQYAYEDRIAALRAQIDRVTSRQLLDQDSFEGKVHDLLSRQAQLESRGAVVASLASHAGFARQDAVALPRVADPRAQSEGKVDGKIDGKTRGLAPARASLNPLLRDREGPQLPAGAQGFAPIEAAPRAEPPRPAVAKPAPLRSSEVSTEGVTEIKRVMRETGALPIPQRLGRIAQSLDTLELRQIRELSSIESRARAFAGRLRQALADAGLPADRMTPPAAAPGAVGGPFVPLKVDPNGSLFEREVARLQTALLAADRYRRIAPYVPLRAPLGGGAEQTSGFGARVDPFLGRAAMHAGVDFRDEYGAPVRSTGAGKVVTAGWQGGYGNMVEIDHGNGLTSRYAHMSSILVAEGQSVSAGAIVGKLGSTGRSTGPHLHYEVRIDGEAVDPSRFLRAGAKLAGL
ncbi:MAG: peptidoglycan DD-metalloendopeptidase family protein [Methylobacteriaceae bacterium]|nr:peptidoglycan DD-metalloendopeptidase family protein [Methylobacteriaceae bacterium]